MPIETVGYAARDKTGVLTPWKFSYEKVGPKDVHIKISHCGVCHTDLHEARDEWGLPSYYPMVPGHEIIGVVESVGAEVKNFKKGDIAGVGYFCNSCSECQSCKEGNEPYCAKPVSVFNWKDYDGRITQGGFARDVICTEKFCAKIPAGLDPAAAAPLLCAGITVYSPMKYNKMDRPGLRIGIVGLGGLGHMAVKFAKAFKSSPVVISTSESKRKTAMEMGAAEFIVSSDLKQMKAAESTLDFIVDTVSGKRNINMYLNLLKASGTLVTVGIPAKGTNLEVDPQVLIFGRRKIQGSLVGGPAEMQEMLDFCGKNKITCEIEKISIDYINQAMERMLKSDVRYRFVIDMSSCPKPEDI